MPIPVPYAMVLIAAMMSLPASAATIGRSTNAFGDDTLTLDGTIEPDDADLLDAAIRDTLARGKRVARIQLDSGGGNLRAGWVMASAIRSTGIATAVPDGATCASACFVVFATGTARMASLHARIGVHGASERNGSDTDQSKAATVEMAKFAKDLGVPDGIIGKMVTTPPKSIFWLSRDDMRSMGVAMADTLARASRTTVTPAVAAVPPSQTLGSVVAASPLSAPGSWDRLAARALTLSAAQNGGVTARSDSCDPGTGTCSSVVFYREETGSPTILRTIRDAGGGLISRVYCSLDATMTRRSCLDAMTGASSLEARDNGGHWESIDAH